MTVEYLDIPSLESVPGLPAAGVVEDARIAAGDRVDHFECQRTRKDGALLDVSVTISPIQDDHGVVTGASVVARDISARKRAEARQHAADERLRTMAAIVESSEDAIIAMAPDGTVTVWNPSAERMAGHTPAETLGAPG